MRSFAEKNYVFCDRETKLPTYSQYVLLCRSVRKRYRCGLVYFPKYVSSLLQQRFHLREVVGLGELESPTSPLSGVRSNQAELQTRIKTEKHFNFYLIKIEVIDLLLS